MLTKKPFTLLQQYSLLSFIAMLVVGVSLGWVVTTSLENNFIYRAKLSTARIVQEEVSKTFAGFDFTVPMEGMRYEEFSKMVYHVLKAPDVKRVKVWNRDKVVVWADIRDLVGRRYPENDELEEALQGEFSSEIKRLDDSEHDFERQFSRLLELYVPIRFRPDGEIDTVFEVYQDLEPLYDDIARQSRLVWGFILMGFAGVYFACFGIVWRASRKISVQTREIREANEKYYGLVESAPDGIIGMDDTGRIVLFNGAAERMFGHTTAEVIGKPVSVLMPDEFRQRHEMAVRALREGDSRRLREGMREYEGLRSDGTAFPIELSLSVNHGRNGTFFTGILRDISERKAIQEQLIVAEKQAMVSVIAGSIGHEINNSLTGVMGYAELLVRTPDDPGLAKRCGETFAAQCQRLTLHAKNLLALSKPREPERKPVDLVPLLDKVTELLHTSGPLRKFVVRKEYAENTPLVLGDEMLLEQVVMNLEINASHAMGDQGVLTLSTRSLEENSFVEFSVTDTGHGIPESRRNQIWLPYFTTKERGKGTGLGLFVSKRIVEQHGGTIDSNSRLGSGATFTVRLPATRAFSP